MRIITSWQFSSSMHTTGCFTAKNKKEKNENLKTSYLTEAIVKTTQVTCSIMECDDHKTIKQELDKETLTDILVGHILDKEINVQKIALETNITVTKKNLRPIAISKRGIFENLASEVKVGGFTVAEDEIISDNWIKLMTEANLQDQEEVMKELFEQSSKGKILALKKNIVGYYLSQGLPDVRLATEVFQRARIILCAKKGPFTTKDDRIILNFVEKEGKDWAKLSRQLGRTSSKTVRVRYELLTDENSKRGTYTVDDDEMILTEVFAVNKNILEDGKIRSEDWQKIGIKLQRSPRHVQEHWKRTLEPMLKRYHAETLSEDIKEVLISHLVDRKLYYVQEVDWNELVKLPKFAGTTPAFLQQQLTNLRVATADKYPELSKVELTTVSIQKYLDNTTRKPILKKLEYQENLCEYYDSNILKKTRK